MNVGLLVNIDNLSYYVKRKIDYGKYKNRLEDLYPGHEIKIVRCIAYGSFNSIMAVKFKTALRKYLGYELKSSDEPYDWNVQLTIDAITMMDNIDSLVLGSNDPILEPLITYFLTHGKSVTLLASNIPYNLRRLVSYYLEIDDSLLEGAKRNEIKTK